MSAADASQEWRAQAACRGMNPALFFPGRGDNDTAMAAKAVCQACDAQAGCLAANLDERFGIWGGTDPTERQKLRRDLRLTGVGRPARPLVHGTTHAYRTHRCRCQPCRAAHAVMNRIYTAGSARRKASA